MTDFYHIEEYTSVVTPDLQVIGTEDRDKFVADYLNNQDLRKQFKLIGTHSEAFHCDEVLATSLLLRTKEFSNSIIVRTRDQALLDQMDIQCDVGAVFNPEANRFDHHQASFTSTWWDDKPKENAEEEYEGVKIKMSSAGLIYKYFGKEIIQQICEKEYKKSLDEQTLEWVY
jgi:uncharacterized UPF0160 family protein